VGAQGQPGFAPAVERGCGTGSGVRYGPRQLQLLIFVVVVERGRQGAGTGINGGDENRQGIDQEFIHRRKRSCEIELSLWTRLGERTQLPSMAANRSESVPKIAFRIKVRRFSLK
jgi:hypothetical protein